MRSLTLAALGASMLVASAPVAFANCAKDDPTGSKVLAARQQASSMCPCTGTTHGAYVKCVVGVTKTLSSGTSPSLPKSCKGAVKKCAAHSTCGKSGAVTCCTMKGNGTECKIKKDATHCAKHGTVGGCTSCCDACPAPGSGPSCVTSTPTTTTTSPTGACGTPTGTVVKGSLTATPGRFNYNSTVGLPGANAACNTNFPGSHVCSITELQGAPASDLACLKDTAGMTVTSFWAIASDAATNPSLQQCEDDVTSGLNWEYATAHTASRGQKVSLDNATGALGAVQSGLQCNVSGSAWVGCCQ
jgi:hypothetical protein